MSRRESSIPAYRRHKASGQAIVSLPAGPGRRKDVLLGRYGTKASRIEYGRVITEWESRGRQIWDSPGAISDLTVAELIYAFWKHAKAHYRKADGTPTSELGIIKLALRPLREMYGASRAADFGPIQLKAVRHRMLYAEDYGDGRPGDRSEPNEAPCRSTINKYVARIKRLFKWGVSEGLLPPTVLLGLQAVAGLQAGRTEAREPQPIRCVPTEVVRLIRDQVLPEVWAMVELQCLTGMRPGEVVRMRGGDIDASGEVWLYAPPEHKMHYRGRSRVICLGPRAQAIVQQFLKPDPQAPLFSPRQAMAERAVRRRIARKSSVPPSQLDRRKIRPRRQPSEEYTTGSYARAIRRACLQVNAALREKAAEQALATGAPPPPADAILYPVWSPNRIRHTRATEIRKLYGIEAARVTLGHSDANLTAEYYAEADQNLALRVAREVG